MKIKSLFFGLFLCGLLCSLGCQPKEPKTPGAVKASGVVTLDGSPVDGAMLCFFPAPTNTSGQAASAVTDAEGKFSLGILVPNEGALPGEYTVSVEKKVNTTPGTPEERSKLADMGKQVPETFDYIIPQKYGNPQTSELKMTIPAGGKTDMLFELKK